MAIPVPASDQPPAPEQATGKPRIASITVTFNPDAGRLERQMQALRGQVDEIVIVDNASSKPVAPFHEAMEAVRVVALAENRGVASGFNIGMREARARGAEFALLLDHDSVPSPGMVEHLVAGYRAAAKSTALPVAAAGPRVLDLRDRREYPFIRLGWLRNAHVRCAGPQELVYCDFLSSSGALIALRHLDRIGEFDESLFIDSVDFEWCCRARSMGYSLVGVCGARLDHWLGDERREVVRDIALVVHSPQRLYYMTRNRLLLYRRSYVPLRWKLKDVLRLLVKFAATMALLRPRASYARMTWLAVRHAFARRGGKL
jgi:rhamnosyltransferase